MSEFEVVNIQRNGNIAMLNTAIFGNAQYDNLSQCSIWQFVAMLNTAICRTAKSALNNLGELTGLSRVIISEQTVIDCRMPAESKTCMHLQRGESNAIHQSYLAQIPDHRHPLALALGDFI